MTPDLLPDSRFAAMLFDMDGTIINSIAAAENVWATWARSHGIDVETFLPTIHGRRAIDTIAGLNLPGLDVATEAAYITQAEIAEVQGVKEIPGAAAFLNQIPPSKWAVVTSAPLQLALTRLKAAGLPIPKVVISAEDVEQGKPQPDCYLLAAKRLGVQITDCLIFEDAEIGIAAAKASGGTLVVVTATHTTHSPAGAAQQLSVQDYSDCANTLLAKLRGHSQR
jgi:mannitol-1-/sugar-/sorbitol-6-phosphatase